MRESRHKTQGLKREICYLGQSNGPSTERGSECRVRRHRRLVNNHARTQQRATPLTTPIPLMSEV